MDESAIVKWKKLGLIFCADNINDLMVTGGRTPVPYCIEKSNYKIFFASYDREGRGRIFNLTIDINQPTKIASLNTHPIIDIGSTGCYDDNGIIPSAILKHEDKIYLYIIGFSIKNKLMFDTAGGVAVSTDNGKSFNKYDGPVIEKSIDDPCWASSPFVIYDNKKYKMWYVSCLKWTKEEDNNKHYYNIRYKESKDGIYWDSQSQSAINFQNEYEYAIARPSIIKDGEQDYKMWYCYRAQKHIDTYRIGYAESVNGEEWIRKDEQAGIDVSKAGWDSEMICYPYVFDHQGDRYMLYNGNGYGKTGFGLAIYNL